LLSPHHTVGLSIYTVAFQILHRFQACICFLAELQDCQSNVMQTDWRASNMGGPTHAVLLTCYNNALKHD